MTKTTPPPTLDLNTKWGPAPPILSFKKISPDVPTPTIAYGKSIGIDLAAFLISETGRYNQILIPPYSSRLIPTGLIFIPPEGFYVQICSRSGLATGNPPLFVANAPGIIDPDYTGEIKVILYNGGHQSAYIKHNDRVAQAILAPAIYSRLTETEVVPTTERGSNGFGSSGR